MADINHELWANVLSYCKKENVEAVKQADVVIVNGEYQVNDVLTAGMCEVMFYQLMVEKFKKPITKEGGDFNE